MKCQACHHTNPPGATECEKCNVILAHAKRGRVPNSADDIDRYCPWNDHGHVCGLYGTNSDTTNGQGPWYCSRHYWQLKGQSKLADDETF